MWAPNRLAVVNQSPPVLPGRGSAPLAAIRDKVAPMRWLILLAASAAYLSAQLAPPNERGVSVGHVHLYVADVDAQKKLWVDLLGAQVTHSGTLELLKFPGILVVVAKARTATSASARSALCISPPCGRRPRAGSYAECRNETSDVLSSTDYTNKDISAEYERV